MRRKLSMGEATVRRWLSLPQSLDAAAQERARQESCVPDRRGIIRERTVQDVVRAALRLYLRAGSKHEMEVLLAESALYQELADVLTKYGPSKSISAS